MELVRRDMRVLLYYCKVDEICTAEDEVLFYVVLTSKLYIVVLCRKKNCTSRIEPNVDSVVSVFVNVNEHKCKR